MLLCCSVHYLHRLSQYEALSFLLRCPASGGAPSLAASAFSSAAVIAAAGDGATCDGATAGPCPPTADAGAGAAGGTTDVRDGSPPDVAAGGVAAG